MLMRVEIQNQDSLVPTQSSSTASMWLESCGPFAEMNNVTQDRHSNRINREHHQLSL